MKNIQMKRTMQWLKDDLVICVYNENGHIGSVVTGQPYIKNEKIHVTLNTWNRLSHKDDIIANLYVKEAVIKYRCVVTCICGVHMNNITEIQMKDIMDWVENDIKNI